MYKVILVPLDGSKRAERILPYVEKLALQSESTVVFLQVIEPSIHISSPYDTAPYFDVEQANRAIENANSYLGMLEGEFRAKGLAAKALVEQGPVVQTIRFVAEAENADLIAMASHGRTGLSRVFYGSVAAGILHQADRPLLLIRSSDP